MFTVVFTQSPDWLRAECGDGGSAVQTSPFNAIEQRDALQAQLRALQKATGGLIAKLQRLNPSMSPEAICSLIKEHVADFEKSAAAD